MSENFTTAIEIRIYTTLVKHERHFSQKMKRKFILYNRKPVHLYSLPVDKEVEKCGIKANH